MHGLRVRSTEAPSKHVSVACAVAFAVLAMVPSAHAVATTVTISPPNPVAGDTVTAEGPFTECVNNATPAYTFTFTLHNPGGSDTVAASGSGTGDANGVHYSSLLSQAGAYTVTEDTYCSSDNSHG